MNIVDVNTFLSFFDAQNASFSAEQEEQYRANAKRYMALSPYNDRTEREALERLNLCLEKEAEKAALLAFLTGENLTPRQKGSLNHKGDLILNTLAYLDVKPKKVQFGYGKNDPLFLAEFLIVGGIKPMKARIYSELRNHYMIIGQVESEFYEISFPTHEMQKSYGYLGVPPEGATLREIESAVLAALHAHGLYQNGRYITDSPEALNVLQNEYQPVLCNFPARESLIKALVL